MSWSDASELFVFLDDHKIGTLQSNNVASGGLGREVFIWDLEAAMVPVARALTEASDESSYEGGYASGELSCYLLLPLPTFWMSKEWRLCTAVHDESNGRGCFVMNSNNLGAALGLVDTVVGSSGTDITFWPMFHALWSLSAYCHLSQTYSFSSFCGSL